ncbi:MAG: rod shape-determining protein MreD [Lachnospiraceae bacterium]|nr:rod shape-determining protein MreD [Lachnospiraceae bacterium]
MKRFISMFFLIVIGFLLQTTVFPHIQLLNVIPNLLIVLTAASGFMWGRKFGLFTGFLCGGLMDCMYNDVIGICIFIFVVIGYINGIANKLYFEDDLSIPLAAIAISDLLYGILYYICMFLMRGRLNMISYFLNIMVPEAIYTIIFGIFIYKFIHWLDGKLYPPEEVSLDHEENKLFS